ncbi:two-component response regulator ARR14-like [Asparagus officinalis]|uniref:two-component response regulator ARR14-like n=1 Tax=Asparagus officinalis TaxID=4686 RepID=UPI00098E2475|nr:two-component response regulator ARR14-like [Asparagus officinalis]
MPWQSASKRGSRTHRQTILLLPPSLGDGRGPGLLFHQTPPDPLLTLPPPPPRPPSSTDAERQPLSLAVETDADDSSLLLPPPAVDQTPTTSRLPLSRPTPTTARLPLSRLKVGPKKILDLMNIPGLTRENVASHLQRMARANKQMSMM